MALDEIGVFLKRYGNATDSLEQVEFNMYDYLEEVIDTIPAGFQRRDLYPLASRQPLSL